MDQTLLREGLAKTHLKFQVHDKDEYNKNEVKQQVPLSDILERVDKKDDEEEEEDVGKKGKGKKGK